MTRTFVTCLALLGPGATGLTAQVTSPGDLSRAHEEWSRPGDCAQCHQVGSRRTSDERCLSCHMPLARRIEAREGLHATRAADCASCHGEHQGLDATLVRFEPAGFDHATIGYPLEGRHTDLACSGCHNTRGVRDRQVRLFKGRYGALTRTYLGLSRSCEGCHMARDPHAGQFDGRECGACHDETIWAPAERFDHASARYPLTGRHRTVACVGCHRERIEQDVGPTGAVSLAAMPGATPGSMPGAAPPAVSAPGPGAGGEVRYRPLEFQQCSSCHRDPHAAEMGAGCAGCHGTSGWNRIPRGRFEGDFDHSATGFPLDGRHAAAACTSCHRARPSGDPEISLTFAGRGLSSYPRPAFESCGSCHLDHHLGAFDESPLGPGCAGCHDSGGWAPSQFDVFKHDETDFVLTGAHRVVPCLDCHEPVSSAVRTDPALRIHLGEQTCASCHARVDPHAGQFEGAGCASCHSTRSFAIESFDHSTTRFTLEGSHESVACTACHVAESSSGEGAVVRYRPLNTACRSCHGESPEPGVVLDRPWIRQ